MDGNGRWAQRQGLPRTVGHGAGEESLLDTTYGALSIGVKVLTVYAFSTENWRRPVDEVRYLMNFNSGLLAATPARAARRGRADHLFRPPRLARAQEGPRQHGRARRR